MDRLTTDMPPEQEPRHCDAWSARADAQSRSQARELRRLTRGITVVELMLTTMIIGILALISTTTFNSYRAKTSVNQAVADIGQIEAAISIFAVDNQGLPNSLAQLGAQYAAMRDPWGNAYQYLSHADVKGKGKFRKDKNIVPINSDYDLWSMGLDGDTVPPLTAQPSRDDIVRANNGRFIGLAAEYDP